MELGNMLFGNSRGDFPIDNRRQYETSLYFLDGINNIDVAYGKFKNDTFEINPYCWCGNTFCEQCGDNHKPNFKHYKSGLEIWWYKYPLRDAYMNIDISPNEFKLIIVDCVESLKENEDD